MDLINKGITTTSELLTLADSLGLPIRVCSKADLKDKRILRGKNCFIINLDDFTGSHWVALFLDSRGKTAFYFDSFGVIYPNEVATFCKKKKIIYNEGRELQALDENFCGQWCVLYLHTLYNAGPANNSYVRAYDDFLHSFDDQI